MYARNNERLSDFDKSLLKTSSNYYIWVSNRQGVGIKVMAGIFL